MIRPTQIALELCVPQKQRASLSCRYPTVAQNARCHQRHRSNAHNAGCARKGIVSLAAIVFALMASFRASAEVIVVRSPHPATAWDASDAIERALARGRTQRQMAPHAAVIIRFANGIYRLSRPIVLGADDSGTSDAPLRIEAAGDKAVTILGSEALHLSALPRSDAAWRMAPVAARRHLLVARFDPLTFRTISTWAPRGNGFGSHSAEILLTQAGRPLMLARFPANGYAQSNAQPLQSGPEVRPTFPVPAAKAQLWSAEPLLMAGGYWTYDWAFESGPVDRVDPISGTLTVHRLGTSYGEAPSLRYFIFNAISELGAPGEFAVVPPSSGIVLWPSLSPAVAPVERARLSQILRIDSAHDIEISGLAFENALGDAVSINSSSRISLHDGLVANAGANGINVTGGANVDIVRMVITHTGENGIILTGGERANLTRGNHLVADSVIRHFAEATRTYRAGVLLQGVGQTVSGCYIADGPHSAILFNGNDHIIKGNEFANVLLETGDAGVIYAGRDVLARGTTIQQNFFHNIANDSTLDTKGVYLDDFLSETAVRDNLFVNVRESVYINGGSANEISGNVFVSPRKAAVTLRDASATWADLQNDLKRNAGHALGADAIYADRYSAAKTAFTQSTPANNQIGKALLFGGYYFGIENNVALFAQQVTAPINLSSRLLPSWSLEDIARVVSGGGPAVAPFASPFTAMDRHTALSRLRYVARASDRSP